MIQDQSLKSPYTGSVPPMEERDVRHAILKTRKWLLNRQHADGYWVAELEGDTILESETILLLAFLGRGGFAVGPPGRPTTSSRSNCPRAAGRCIPAAASRSAAA